MESTHNFEMREQYRLACGTQSKKNEILENMYFRLDWKIFAYDVYFVRQIWFSVAL